MKKLSYLVFVFLSFFLFANPEKGEVKSGEIQFSSKDQTFQILQKSDKAVINWQDFSIQKGEKTEFILPSSSSSTLNRVIGENISEIHGALKSNGALYLVNPHGIVVGPNGTVDTHSFLASTYDLSDKDYLSEKFNFKETLHSKIINEGVVRASYGDIVLISTEIENSGTLSAEKGKVSLNAGYELYLFPAESMKTTIRLKKQGQVATSGLIKAVDAEIKASGGKAYIVAINASGLIDARGFSEKDGRVILCAEDNMISVSGKISAKTQTEEKELGGKVHLLGDVIFLEKETLIDVSSKNDGGEVLIGGDYQGKNPEIKNATFVSTSRDTKILADSLEEGNGGRVILWSDQCTNWKGEITAQGGDKSGDGGFIEVSSKGLLIPEGKANTKAPYGKTGTLLLDPYNVTISAAADANFSWNSGVPNIGRPTGTAVINVTTLNGLLAASNVVIQTYGTGTEAGNITITGGITWADQTKLTLIADGQIMVDSSAGTAYIKNTYNDPSPSNFDAMEFIALGNTSGTYDGFYDYGSEISSYYGNIYIQGKGGDTGDGNDGIFLYTHYSPTVYAKILSLGAGAEAAKITLVGTGGPSANSNRGLYTYGDTAWTEIGSVDGDIHITGTSLGTGSSNHGISNSTRSKIYATGDGKITLIGHGSKAGTGSCVGIMIEDWNWANGAPVFTTNGDLNLIGKGGGDGTSYANYGIMSQANGDIYTTGTGNLTIIAIAGEGVNTGWFQWNQGIHVSYWTHVYTSGGGNIKIVGIGGGTGGERAAGYGATVEGRLETIDPGGGNAGDITIIGYGSQKTDGYCYGLWLHGYYASAPAYITAGSGGNIRLFGKGGGYGTNNENNGIRMGSSFRLSVTGAGSMTVVGHGGPGLGANRGIDIRNSSNVYTGSGDLKIVGIGDPGSVNTFNDGIFLYDYPNIYTSTGNINIIGIAGKEGSYNHGIITYHYSDIYINDPAATSHITMIGYGGGRVAADLNYHDNYGVLNDDYSTIENKGDGDIHITGIGGNGYTGAAGVDNNATSSIIANTGKIIIRGTGGGDPPGSGYLQSGQANYGIVNSYAGSIYSVSGDVILVGRGGYGTDGNNCGVRNFSSSNIYTGGNLNIIGLGGGSGADDRGIVNQTSSQIYTTGSGNLTMKGQSGSGGVAAIGIYNNASKIYTANGNLNLIGVSTGIANYNYGINNDSASEIYSSGSGKVKLVGQGSKTGTSYNYGIQNYDSGSKIYSTTGSLTLIGNGGGNTTYNFGIHNNNQASIYSTTASGTAGNVYLIGTGGNGTDSNYGIYNDGWGTGASIYSSYTAAGTGGAVSLIGIGRGTGSNNVGIYNNNFGKIYATSAVNVVLTGYGSSKATGGSAYGIIQNGLTIDTKIRSEGDLTLRGIAGPGATSFGIYNINSADTISANGTLIKDSIDGE